MYIDINRIAVIGAGISGLTLAKSLKEKYDVVIFEKSQGVGGRMATRRRDSYQFDHGAQCFNVHSKDFKSFIAPFIELKLIKMWNPRIATIEKGKKPCELQWPEPHYMPTPKMTSLAKKMSMDLDIRLNTKIIKIQKKDGNWQLFSEDGICYGLFQWVALALPAPQALALTPHTFSEIKVLKSIRMKGCYSLLIGLEGPWPFSWQAAKVKNSSIGWIAAHQGGTPKKQHTSIVVHSTNDWAENHMDIVNIEVQSMLVKELDELLASELPTPIHMEIHKWKYAMTEMSASSNFLMDQRNCLAICGDWCLGDRVEDAFLSAKRLAKKIWQCD
ncbi:MAG: renalase [Candidatus Omnitrophota bacterium]